MFSPKYWLSAWGTSRPFSVRVTLTTLVAPSIACADANRWRRNRCVREALRSLQSRCRFWGPVGWRDAYRMGWLNQHPRISPGLIYKYVSWWFLRRWLDPMMPIYTCIFVDKIYHGQCFATKPPVWPAPHGGEKSRKIKMPDKISGLDFMGKLDQIYRYAFLGYPPNLWSLVIILSSSYLRLSSKSLHTREWERELLLGILVMVLVAIRRVYIPSTWRNWTRIEYVFPVVKLGDIPASYVNF